MPLAPRCTAIQWRKLGGRPVTDMYPPGTCLPGLFAQYRFSTIKRDITSSRWITSAGTGPGSPCFTILRSEGGKKERCCTRITIFQDLTEQKIAEARLREGEGRLNAVFETVHTESGIINRETHIIQEANPAAARMFGLPQNESSGGPAISSFVRLTQGVVASDGYGAVRRKR